MSEPVSKQRQQADKAFDNARSNFLSRQRAVAEMTTLADDRQQITQRLREARIAKEQQDRLQSSTTKP